jgi:hypothetical protein
MKRAEGTPGVSKPNLADSRADYLPYKQKLIEQRLLRGREL